MGLVSCPECNKKVSESANNCPKCGYVLTAEKVAEIKAADQMMFKIMGVGCLGFFVVTLIVNAIVPKRDDGTEATMADTTNATKGDGYKSLVGNVNLGALLYLRTDKTFIGTVADVESSHRFEDGTAGDGVLVSFVNGEAFWVPRKTVHQIYVTR